MKIKHGYEVADAAALRDSGNALLVSAPEFDEDQWIPHSQITDDSEVYEEGADGTLVVTEWFAEQRGWL